MNLSRRGFLAGLGSVAVARVIGDVGDAEPVVRFGFITDCHYAADLPVSLGRHYAEGLGKMRDFVAKMNELKVDFVVEGGDLKDRGETAARSLEYLDAVEREFAAFAGPRYHVLGNHDHDNLSKEEFLAHVANADQSAARAYYAFERGGVKFVVLDACYRPDGKPYCRGDFDWRETAIPDEQVEFLKAELASATGPVVPVVHQQLDAEDATCIRNAAEIRALLEASGRVRLVLQGHYHEGSFREINGIGYFTSEASVIGPAAVNACSLVEVYASGAAKITSFAPSRELATSFVPGAWKRDGEWRPGHYQVHYIYSGRGEAMLHVFPDGTTMLLDCGDTMRFYHNRAEMPLPCDPRIRAGEYTARYVLEHSPKGEALDIFHLSHYHEDHFGGTRYHGGVLGKGPAGEFYRCGLADAARFLRIGRIVDRASPSFDDPHPVLGAGRDGTPVQAKAVYAYLAATQGTKIERFRLGERLDFGGLRLFNLCANGRYVRRDGTIRDLYAERVKAGEKRFNENGMSCGFVVSYGKFSYFSAGDFSDAFKDPLDPSRRVNIEDELAEAVGPVEVAKLTHHGHHSMGSKLVAALAARVWTACTLDAQHCTDDTMCRLADRTTYPHPRLMLPQFLPVACRPRTEAGLGYLPDVAQCVLKTPCHIVLDVPPGGESYTFSCYSATRLGNPLVGEFTFLSRA